MDADRRHPAPPRQAVGTEVRIAGLIALTGFVAAITAVRPRRLALVSEEVEARAA